MASQNRQRRLVRAYARAIERRARVASAVSASFDGFWLGVMDRDALALLDQSYYESRREFVGDQSYAYDDDVYNLLGLYEWEAAVVDEHFPPGGRVVVTGAGTGREVFALVERGFDAVGYEPNPRLRELGVDFLRRHDQSDRLHPIERDVFHVATGRCDAVVVGCGSYMLIRGGRAASGSCERHANRCPATPLFSSPSSPARNARPTSARWQPSRMHCGASAGSSSWRSATHSIRSTCTHSRGPRSRPSSRREDSAWSASRRTPIPTRLDERAEAAVVCIDVRVATSRHAFRYSDYLSERKRSICRYVMPEEGLEPPTRGL